MTMTGAIGRVQEIQATLTQLSGRMTAPVGGGSSTATATATAASASAFAEALASSGGASATAGPAAPGTSLAVPSGSVSGGDVVDTAKRYLGVPYVLGGEDANGIDCSGLVQRVFKDLGIDVPRLVSGQSTLGTEVASLKDAKPGDLIVNDNGGHISIYLGDNKILYAPKPGDKVKINDVYFPESEIVTIRRVVPSEAPAAPAALAGGIASASLGSSPDLATAAMRSLLGGMSS